VCRPRSSVNYLEAGDYQSCGVRVQLAILDGDADVAGHANLQKNKQTKDTQ